MRTYSRCYEFSPDTDPLALVEEVRRAHPQLIAQPVRDGLHRNEAVVELLTAQTFAARKGKRLLAKRLEVDFLLRIAGTTQISEAVEMVGAKKGAPFLLLLGGPLKWLNGVDSMIEGRGKRVGRSALVEKELMAVEKAALLNTE